MYIMENILQQFANTVLNNYRGDLFIKVDNILHDFNYTNHLYVLETIYADQDNLKTEDSVDLVHVTLIKAMIEILSELGIFVDYDHDLDMILLSDILTSIKDMYNWEDKEYLLQIIDSGFDNEEILSNIVAHIQNKHWMDYYNIITSVSITYIDDLREKLANSVVVQDSSIEEDMRIVYIGNAVKNFLSKYKVDAFIELINNGYKLGFDVGVYLDKLIDHEMTVASDIAQRYMVSSLAAGDSIEEAIDQASVRLEFRVKDIALLNSVMNHISKFLTEKYNA